SLLIAMYARLLMLASRREEALALRAEIAETHKSRYVAPAATLIFAIIEGDREHIARELQHNIDAGTGVTTIALSGIARELDQLRSDPHLGSLIRQLTYYAGRESS
ncbi:MAG TPA: hypothetical protein VKP02_07270, partial [Gemmatimonadaceae bacterium]|nr:hypothetical protein [Gemmatimonadaceae bacterium]